MTGSRVAHIDAFSGVGAARLLGAAIDAGAEVGAIRELLDGLQLGGWELSAERTERAGVPAVRAVVTGDDRGVVRTWGNIRELLASASLPDPVRTAAVGTFRRLAEVESRLHRVDQDRVHLHELGSLEAIVAITAACAGLHLLEVKRLTCGPVGQGVGMTRGPHGMVPVPGPEVLELLRGAPTYATGEPSQLCTPTGAALLAELVDEWCEMPLLRVASQGYGAGRRDLQRANVLHLIIGEATVNVAQPQRVQLAAVVDERPEQLDGVLAALRDAGADEVWVVPVQLSSRQAGSELVCVANPRLAGTLRGVLLTRTTAVRVRGRLVDAWQLERSVEQVVVGDQPVRLRVSSLEGRVLAVVADAADCRAAAALTGLSPAEVAARAETARRRSQEPPPPPLPGA